MAACGLYFEKPVAQLVRVVAEPPGPNCGQGGSAIETGPDRNGDGVLEDSEVTSTSYICTPQTSLSELVIVVPAPPNTCPASETGQQIEIGYDLNANGVLDPNEITSTQLVCAGENTLVSVVTEPPGSHCAAGGDAINVGVDANGDGVLEPSEVTSTSYVCLPSGTITGDYTIHNQADVNALAGVTVVTGTLGVDAPTLTQLSLPALESVGDFECCASDGAMTSVALRGLQAGSVHIDDPALVTVDLSRFRDGTINVCTPPTGLSLPAFVSGALMSSQCVTGPATTPSISAPLFVSGRLGLGPSPQTAISLPSFQTGTVQITSSFTSVSLPAFTSGDISIVDAQLTQLALPSLVTSNLNLYQVDVPSLDLPSFVGPSLELAFDPALTIVSLPSLQSPVMIDDCPMYPTCDCIAFWERFGYQGRCDGDLGPASACP